MRASSTASCLVSASIPLLAGRVTAEIGDAECGDVGRDVHDCAASRVAHSLGDLHGAEERALQVGVDNRVPNLLGDLQGGRPPDDRCVVDEHVDPAEALAGGLDEPAISPTRSRSTDATRAWRPCPRMPSAVASAPRSSPRYATTTSAPSAAAPIATARPIPLLAPVTRTTFPASFMRTAGSAIFVAEAISGTSRRTSLAQRGPHLRQALDRLDVEGLTERQGRVLATGVRVSPELGRDDFGVDRRSAAAPRSCAAPRDSHRSAPSPPVPAPASRAPAHSA